MSAFLATSATHFCNLLALAVTVRIVQVIFGVLFLAFFYRLVFLYIFAPSRLLVAASRGGLNAAESM